MRIIKQTLFFLFISLMTPPAQAHDFWLSPKTYKIVPPTSQVPVRFFIGHHHQAEPWALSWDRVVALRSYSEGGFKDQTPNIVINQALIPGFANISLPDEGTHVLGFESYHSFSELSAKRFNDYAKKEGLSLVLAQRERLQQTEQSGRELYSRKAKTILQVGDRYTNNVTEAIGHMLEIVPLTHPYRLEESGQLSFKVLFRGKRLPNALVKMANLSQRESNTQKITTDANGEVTFSIEAQGEWLVSVIWATPLQYKDKADFESYFASLSFAY